MIEKSIAGKIAWIAPVIKISHIGGLCAFGGDRKALGRGLVGNAVFIRLDRDIDGAILVNRPQNGGVFHLVVSRQGIHLFRR